MDYRLFLNMYVLMVSISACETIDEVIFTKYFTRI